jgi:hypothetical protein
MEIAAHKKAPGQFPASPRDERYGSTELHLRADAEDQIGEIRPGSKSWYCPIGVTYHAPESSAATALPEAKPTAAIKPPKITRCMLILHTIAKRQQLGLSKKDGPKTRIMVKIGNPEGAFSSVLHFGNMRQSCL